MTSISTLLRSSRHAETAAGAASAVGARFTTVALPWGAAWAVVFVGLFHVLANTWIHPVPVAREPLRRKMTALTSDQKPGVLIAGDCRATYQVDPRVVTGALHWPAGRVINVGTPGQTPAAFLAAIREFRGHVAPQPIVILSISITLVNDTVAANSRTNELLWSISFRDRLRLVQPRYAFTAVFLAERTWLTNVIRSFRPEPWQPTWDEAGFERRPDPDRVLTAKMIADQIDGFHRHWVVKPRLGGVAWKQMLADLRSLRDAGVQLVVLDSPLHPALVADIEGMAAGKTYERFRGQLERACRSLDIPLLRYAADDLGLDEPSAFFYEVTQLNHRGAAVLSRRIAADLLQLLVNQRLTLPYADGAQWDTAKNPG